MTNRIRLIAAFAIVATLGIVLAVREVTASPVITYASVVIRPGAPTAGSGFQASIGVLYVDSSTRILYVKNTTAATGWVTIGDTAFPIDDSATALTLGNSTSADVTTINGRTVATSTNGTAHAFTLNYTPSATMTSDNSGIYVAVGGTADATAGNVAVNGFNVDATTTRSAGGFSVITQGLRVFASGGQDVRAGRFSATGGTAASYGVNATSTATAIDNFGVLGSATGAGTNNYGGSFAASGAGSNVSLRAMATGAGTTNIGGNFTASGAGVNTAIKTDNGNVLLNVTSGEFRASNRMFGFDATPAANHGTIDTDSTDGAGNVTGVGAFTSVVITFGDTGYAEAWCTASPNANTVAEYITVTKSATAPTFNCFNSTTGVAANCNDFSYICIERK